MSGIGITRYQPGILQGVVVSPSGETVDIRYIGSPMELMQVAHFLTLEPVGEPEMETGLQAFKDERGGYATLQPVERASDLLMTVIAAMRERGFPPPSESPFDL